MEKKLNRVENPKGKLFGCIRYSYYYIHRKVVVCNFQNWSLLLFFLYSSSYEKSKHSKGNISCSFQDIKYWQVFISACVHCDYVCPSFMYMMHWQKMNIISVGSRHSRGIVYGKFYIYPYPQSRLGVEK